MKKISTKELRPGMVLEKPIVCRQSYQILLNSGTILTEKYIQLLEKFDVNQVYINDLLNNNSNVDFYARRLEQVTQDKAAKEIYINIYKEYDKLTNDIRLGEKLSLKNITCNVENLIEGINRKKNILIQLTALKDNDPVAFTHSINVAIFSLCLATSLSYSRDRMIDIGLGALLHDIGKTRIPEQILYKPSSLTDEEFAIVQRHPLEGYSILVSQKVGNPIIWSIIRDHHERCDGTGYPNALNFQEISPEARLVAISDVYEAVTSDRCYRLKLQPHEGVEILMGYGSMNNLDTNLVNKFLTNIAIYPIGSMVELSDGTYGKVIEVYSQVPTRPRIQVIDTINYSSGKIVDLLFTPTMFIKKIID